jgi:predicted O-methyltransferase YrrM
VDVKLGLDKLNKLLLQVRAEGLIVIDNVLWHKKEVLYMP